MHAPMVVVVLRALDSSKKAPQHSIRWRTEC
jgi:hypothetical protein